MKISELLQEKRPAGAPKWHELLAEEVTEGEKRRQELYAKWRELINMSAAS